ncbi:COP9 signalosome complex subunit 3-like [Uranotaenia lowii]|uniref:COP9 signalosome complex subunit 3-like n=1 Tax=Uranotaenia lowii TaxID=190385 RepID=UPI0024798B76|nr:COP9 signalosome complex subunit 3-like [Uranotaenia lowii]
MASPLEHYVNHVRTMSSAGNFRELVEYLLESTDLLAKNGNILDNVLETLDIQQHSLGVLFVLVIKFSNGEQVRFATQPYFELCHQFASSLVKNNQYTIQGIQGTSRYLCQLCLAAKIFSPALRFLDVDVTAIANTVDSNYDTKYSMLYFYYRCALII